MAKDLKLVANRKAIELKHDRRIKGCDVAMPYVAGDAREKYVGVPAFECLRNRQFWNAVLLPKIFAEEQGVDACRIAAHDHVLVVVGKNLRLDEITRTQRVRHCFDLANAAPHPLLEPF